MKFLVLTLFLACSSTAPKKERLPQWIGKTAVDLNQHPYFKGLPSTVKGNTWLFEHLTRPESAAYCASLGGCAGLPVWDCHFEFKTESNRIVEAYKYGTCPENGELFPNTDP